MLHALYGSLADGLLVTPWVEGRTPSIDDLRPLRQLFETGVAMHRAGHFEWDGSPRNLLDDGRQTWLFDFGYQYRFDPLTRLNSADDGPAQTAHHLVERVGARWTFGALLQREAQAGEAAAVAAFEAFQCAGIDAMTALGQGLARDGAQPQVLDFFARWTAGAAAALRADPVAAYRSEAWAAHRADVAGDLAGRSCTPMTLRRLNWLLQNLDRGSDAPARAGRPTDAAGACRARLLCWRQDAVACQVVPPDRT